MTIRPQYNLKFSIFINPTHLFINHITNIKIKIVEKDISDIYSFFGNRKVSLVKEITKIHETVYNFNLGDKLCFEKEGDGKYIDPKGEVVMVVSKAEKSNSENEMSKVNILTVFFIRLVVSLSICSIFTECSSIEESSEDLYNNRDLAVSVATILIMEIPFTFLEVMLNKTKISEKYLPLKKKIIVNTKYRHTLVYILFVLM